jgi:hypothetical protein
MKTNPLTPGLLHKTDAYLLASHVWQHVINKKADIVRVYLPPTACCQFLITACAVGITSTWWFIGNRRTLIGVSAAIIIYVMSGDLALRPRLRPRQPLSGDVRK